MHKREISLLVKSDCSKIAVSHLTKCREVLRSTDVLAVEFVKSVDYMIMKCGRRAVEAHKGESELLAMLERSKTPHYLDKCLML